MRTTYNFLFYWGSLLLLFSTISPILSSSKRINRQPFSQPLTVVDDLSPEVSTIGVHLGDSIETLDILETPSLEPIVLSQPSSSPSHRPFLVSSPTFWSSTPSSFPSISLSSSPSSYPSVSLSPSTTSSPTHAPHTPVVISSNSSWTWYTSYPKCCKDQPNYDPKAPTQECTQYSGCVYAGIFAAVGKRDFSFVES
jgi:hypothetical protein